MAWQILAMDISRKNYDLGRPIIEKAGVSHKIDFKEGPALPALDEMLKNVCKYDGRVEWFGYAWQDLMFLLCRI